MTFQKEADFEEALIKVLADKGWEKEVIKNPTEQDLIRNWAKILYDNNRGIDRLNNYPLTDGEMQQIIEQITELRTPLKLNGLINGKTVSIKRDNPDDKLHCGTEISLKIYDRREIAAGQSRYQIAQQPVFPSKSKMLNDRRGDLMLLINGMPVIHIELKRSGVPVSQAYNQIEKYSYEGVFTGLFSLVQVFVAMNPEETRYFANPGPDGKFNTDYYFHWADFNNEPINDWKAIASSLLSIPMAHQLIGFYTVADNADGVLKVMRSYQYYAASAISDVVSKTKWDSGKQRGGYIWHTTGSGKTMTSFKSAQLIANSNDADKVIFLTDRIELGTQSLKEYRAFADENETVQATENTYVLLSKLKSNATADTLIVTSIQKMSNIRDEDGGLNASDIEIINGKRLVFIVDEAHRSTFGDMLSIIKETFPNAIFFGFTGTPVFEENAKKNNAQTDVFGNELHRYSIADGIRDKNVLGFDPYKVLTFRDKDVRKVVALEKAKAATEEEAISDPKKAKIFYEYMDSSTVKMAGFLGDDGKWVKGIEDYLPKTQYLSSEHQSKVVEDIQENWLTLSHNGKFHAIFATSSIPEAIDYYRLLKAAMPELRISCLFDPNISNEDGDYREYRGQPIAFYKEQGLIEILTDYNMMFGQDFSIATHARFKKDLSLRLAHKEQYKRVEREPEKQLDLLIVVDQMLTGFDSKWVNTLYMDKILEYENIIQAFSRTNRLFGPDKPFGIIRYYRKPHTMEQNVSKAVKLYSGDRPIGLFVEKLLNDYAEFHERQTTMDFHHQLKGAILDAVDEGLIERDPTRKAIIKGKPPVAKKIKYLNQFELHTLLISLDLKDKVNWDYFILLVAKTGMRFSEALALTPKDFDFAHQTLSISKTWDYKGKGGFQPTKNKSSVRKIQIDWQTVIQFSELVKHLPEDKPIFVNSTVYNSTVNDILGRHCKACNIPIISVHGLRHTHASLLLFTGVSIASVARRLGHSSMTTTQKTYLHIIQELENKDIDLVMRSLSSLS